MKSLWWMDFRLLDADSPGICLASGVLPSTAAATFPLQNTRPHSNWRRPRTGPRTDAIGAAEVLLQVDFNSDGAMVRAWHVVADEGAFEARAQGGADEEVVDAPTHVSASDTGHRTPPGIMPAIRLEHAESVEKTGLHKRGETGSFLGRETVIVHVVLWIGEVDFGVRHVEVAAEDDGLFPFKLLEVAEEIAVPLSAIGEPREFALRVGDIDVHQEEVSVLGGEHATFIVVLADADAVGHVQRAGLGEDGSAGVALFLRGVPVSGIGDRPELLDVIGTGFGFLQAENVGFLGVEVIEEIFPQHGAQAVDVPGNQLHNARLSGIGRQTNLPSGGSMQLDHD